MAVLISGGGSNLQSFIDAVKQSALDVSLAVVISNVAGAGGLRRAASAGVPALCIPHEAFATRADFETALTESLKAFAPDIIVLAGFMRVLTPEFVRQYAGKILNIHPSLLPAYPGLHTHQRALDNGDRWHGCTVHFVTEELDAGPLIIQGKVRVNDGDTAETLAARVLAVEHRIYPLAADLLASGRLQWNGGSALLDGKPLRTPLAFDPVADRASPATAV